MIKITDSKETIILTKEDILIIDNYIIIKPIHKYWVVKLFIVVEKGFLKEIIKAYDIEEEPLDRFKSKTKLSDTLVLSEGDFKRFKKLYENMHNKIDYRKKAIIKAYSELLSYEYFQATVLEDNPGITIEELFEDLGDSYNYEKCKEEIIDLSKKYIKDKYNIK